LVVPRFISNFKLEEDVLQIKLHLPVKIAVLNTIIREVLGDVVDDIDKT
jgi:hypothetical protein